MSETTIDRLDFVSSDDPDGKLRDAVDGRTRLKHLFSRPLGELKSNNQSLPPLRGRQPLGDSAYDACPSAAGQVMLGAETAEKPSGNEAILFHCYEFVLIP
ncbi:protein of unknown function [Methylocaldum szegediense]|uniref:Uncharacterized protein n=2 Tax=Methylocaldum szegediense TaxID=73780 RepID=A0ABN8WYI7_9GAMM|nr:protein of unknown function [Methylocaldum szegediense]